MNELFTGKIGKGWTDKGEIELQAAVRGIYDSEVLYKNGKQPTPHSIIRCSVKDSEGNETFVNVRAYGNAEAWIAGVDANDKPHPKIEPGNDIRVKGQYRVGPWMNKKQGKKETIHQISIFEVDQLVKLKVARIGRDKIRAALAEIDKRKARRIKAKK